jgi:hypothetical protein
MADQLDHLRIAGFTESSSFKSTLSVRKPPPPARNRQSHGRALLREIASLREQEEALAVERAQSDVPTDAGMSIALHVSAPDALEIQKLEWKRDGIEVLNVRSHGDSVTIVLHVPEGRLSAFESRIRGYLDENTKSGKPKNAALINAIDNFRKAAFEELWTDDRECPADDGNAYWFQLWLRSTDDPRTVRDQFAELARRFQVEVEPGFSRFPGRIVVAAYGRRSSLERAVELLDHVAEIRSTATTAEFFLSDLSPADQADWVRELLSRANVAPDDGNSPYIALLDTGVNFGHALISGSLEQRDMHAVDPSWLQTDHEGHGTQMAGLVLHGSLTRPLNSTERHDVPHRLESVKILPPNDQTPPHLYGAVTERAVELVEVSAPERRRSHAMMTTADPCPGGLPSEWSAAIDQLAAGSISTLDDEEAPMGQRLFILAAGNVAINDWADYPDSNALTPIEDPAQAWNALTVGAFTKLTQIDHRKWPSLTPIARNGALSPASSTSVSWTRSSWPFKPDVVAEGGNGSMETTGPIVGPESLRLVTTSHVPDRFAETGDTSAAAAEVARLAGHISARYPDYRPETVRALIVHGAQYTDEMLSGMPLNPGRNQKESLVRRFGFGAISFDHALTSASRRPVLVVESSLRPYRRDGSTARLNEHNLHALPWPAEQLRDHGDADVRLKVTLSYFVFPNPSRRGWQSKFRYQSHGLRFAVKGATETAETFAQRINKIEREKMDSEESASGMNDPDRAGWLLGYQLRSRGSIHSDVWSGSAAELADKSDIAIFPVGGWWKDWAGGDGQGAVVRYSLIVSLEIAGSVDIDLYTPIQAELAIPVTIDGQ